MKLSGSLSDGTSLAGLLRLGGDRYDPIFIALKNPPQVDPPGVWAPFTTITPRRNNVASRPDDRGALQIPLNRKYKSQLIFLQRAERMLVDFDPKNPVDIREVGNEPNLSNVGILKSLHVLVKKTGRNWMRETFEGDSIAAEIIMLLSGERKVMDLAEISVSSYGKGLLPMFLLFHSEDNPAAKAKFVGRGFSVRNLQGPHGQAPLAVYSYSDASVFCPWLLDFLGTQENAYPDGESDYRRRPSALSR